MEQVRVGGFTTVAGNRDAIAQWMSQACITNRDLNRTQMPVRVFSSNGQGIALHGRDPQYDTAMAGADMIHADGMPVVLASRYLTKTPIAQRSATTDLFHDVARIAVEKDLSFFVLGGDEALNARAVDAMLALYPTLRIAGRHHGYFQADQDAEICAQIVAADTDVLWVGLGKPLQEIWSHRNAEALRGVGCIKTCGGLYAFLTGDAPRAPEWMQKAGLEWLHRFAQDPRRLFKRYLITNTISAWRLMTQTG